MSEIRENKTDLGQGKVSKLMFKLAVPTIIAQLVNLLYNLVDRIYIGHIPVTGDLALTGLGLCFPVLMAVSAFSSLFGQGGAPRAAIFMGQGENERAEKLMGSCAASLAAAAIILTILLEIFAEPLLYLFGASKNTIPFALDYVRIYALGTVFVMLTMGLNMFITTQGFAKVAMKTVVIGAVSNIVLDPVFIFLFKMDVMGAALATILSQAISALWIIRFLTGKETKLRLKKENLRIDPKIMLPVMALGVSPFIMMITESVLNIAFNSSLYKYGDDIAVGAMTILSSVMQLQFMPVQGLAQGAQPIISYNYGAGNMDRVKQAYKILIICCVAYTMVFWAAVELFPAGFARIFNNEPSLVEMTAWALRIYMGASCIFGLQMAVQQIFIALGQAKLSLFLAIFRKIILLIPLIYILPNFMADKVMAVFLAEPISDFVSATTCAVLFAVNIKKILANRKKI